MSAFPLAGIRAFAKVVKVPTRDRGVVPIKKLFGTQDYMLREMAAGWERGVREFVNLKGGRQIGGSSLWDIISLYWPQKYGGIMGALVADDDDNRDYRRALVLQMLASLPPSHRFPTRVDNQKHLAWEEPNNSHLLFMAAGKRSGKRLGQGKGLNYADGDEVASFVDPNAISVLRATFSEKHEWRLYGWTSTGAEGPFHDMWNTAERAVSQKAIFIGWWRHEDYRITPKQRDLWARYGTTEPTESERLWLRAIKRRYEVVVSRDQLAWHRWKLAEAFNGDETLFAQEYGSLPEDCFQTFGDKFIPPAAIQQLRIARKERMDAAQGVGAEPPHHLTYAWSRYFDEVKVVPADEESATLTVWEEPVPGALYLVGGKSAFSDDNEQPQDAVIVWRLYPDQIVQVAEYVTEDADVLRFAWAVLHLCGAYRTTRKQTYLCVSAEGTGRAVIDEIRRMQETGYGLSPHVRPRGRELYDFSGAIAHHFQRRPDTLTTPMAMHYMANAANRMMLLHGLRGQLMRGEVEIRSAALIDELADLRRGSDGDNDRIGGGANRDGRALAAAFGVRTYLDDALRDVRRLVAPKVPDPKAPQHVGQAMVQAYFQGRIGR